MVDGVDLLNAVSSVMLPQSYAVRSLPIFKSTSHIKYAGQPDSWNLRQEHYHNTHMTSGGAVEDPSLYAAERENLPTFRSVTTVR